VVQRCELYLAKAVLVQFTRIEFLEVAVDLGRGVVLLELVVVGAVYQLFGEELLHQLGQRCLAQQKRTSFLGHFCI
jgi:hypothetical protein